MRGHTEAPAARIALAYRYHALRRDLTNLSFRRHAGFDGFIVSMHQSGGHWLVHMLSLVLTREAGLPEPGRLRDYRVVGTPKRPPRHEVAPRIGVGHTVPSPLIRLAALRRRLELPRYAVLVRDVRASLVSHYEKWKERYRVSFSEFLRGDPSGRRFDKDIWWDIRFLNAWGAVRASYPQETLVLRYEDLLRDPLSQLERLCNHFGVVLGEPEAVLRFAIERSSKEEMSRLERDNDPLKVVRHDDAPPCAWFTSADRRFLRTTLARFLKHDFGYDYSHWDYSHWDYSHWTSATLGTGAATGARERYRGG